MDEGMLADVSVLKRVQESLKKEVKNIQEELYKIPTDLKKQFNFQLA